MLNLLPVAWGPRSWDLITPADTMYTTSMAYGAGVFVAVGSYGTCFTSDDYGATWVSRTIPYAQWASVAWNGTVFIATASGFSTAYSSDGTTWYSGGSALALLSWNGCTARSDIVVAVSGSSGRAMYSTDAGLTWQSGTSGSEAWYGCADSGALFCAVGATGKVMTSPDGINWTRQTSGNTYTWYAIAWNGTVFCAVGNGGKVMTSPDGITWALRASDNNILWVALTVNAAEFVAVSSTGRAMSSSNGITWNTHSTYSSTFWGAVGARDNILVAAANGAAKAMRSLY
jgi:hypothetical protein